MHTNTYVHKFQNAQKEEESLRNVKGGTRDKEMWKKEYNRFNVLIKIPQQSC